MFVTVHHVLPAHNMDEETLDSHMVLLKSCVVVVLSLSLRRNVEKERKNNDFGHWIVSSDIEIPETFFGFLYQITNKKTGRKYLGKKQAKTMKKMPPLKGKKRARRVEKL